jgi:hypothetical protein
MSKTNNHIRIDDLTNGTPIAVGTTTTGYSETFICLPNVTYAFEYQFTSAGAVDARIEIEQGNTPPATEGAISTNMVEPEDAATFDDSITDELNHVKAYTPAATKFLRARIVGQGSNAATTTLSKFNVCTEVN